jgi:uncharacterized protein with HEPN domain
MYKDPLEYIRHILDECEFILSVIGPDTNKTALLSDETLKRAVVRSLEIIGEASKQIPVDFKLKWGFVNWKNMAGMRDRLIHDYMGINYSIVWDVAKNKIPEITEQIISILDQEVSQRNSNSPT